MSIIKIIRRENHFVQLDKRIPENVNISWRAKGLLVYLLSRPPDWTVRTSDLIKRSTDGRDAVYSILQELIKAGYVHREDGERTVDGKFSTKNYLVFEEPCREF